MKVLELELKGRFHDKVQIAETFHSAYDLLDRLSDVGVRELKVVYGEDFHVESGLLNEFSRAAREALAYKDALTFGRDVPTRIDGLERIACQQTREMAKALHAAG